MADIAAVGSKAPGFECPASDGETYRLDRILPEKKVLLIFYPANNTPG